MLEIAALIIIGLLILLCFFLYQKAALLENNVSELKTAKQSQSTKYGKLAEQWIPFMDSFPYNPQNFRFIGSPIDGVAFEEDCVYFCEFKFSGSGLSEKERKIKKLVEEGKVKWIEFRLR